MNAQTVWLAVGALAGLFIPVGGWMLLIERRMGKFMTREEHEGVCDRRNTAIQGSLDKIEGILQKQDERASAHRDKVDEKLTAVKQDVALIKQRLKLSEREGA